LAKTIYNGLIESNIQHIELLQEVVERKWKADVDERGVEAIKHVECCPGQATWHVLVGGSRRVKCTYRQGRVRNRRLQREKDNWIKLGHVAGSYWLSEFFSS